MVPKVTNLCRLCAEPCPPETVNHSIENSEVRSKLETVFNFELAIEEPLPKLVCPECLSKVTKWYSYHETVHFNQSQLKKLISAEEPQPMPQDNESLGDDRLDVDGNESDSTDSSEESVRKKPKRATTTAKRKYTKRSPLEKSKPKDEKRIKQTEEENRKIQEFFTITCEFCSDTFDTFYRLQLHTRRDHNARASIKCCNLVLYRKYKIIEHIDSHLNPNRFHCDVCNRSYKNRYYLELHNLKKHSDSEKPFKCDKCPQSFPKEFLLKAHLPTHIQAECPLCHKMVANAFTLRSHMDIMHGDKTKLICETCGEQFRTKLGMERHIKRHQGVNPVGRVQCHICNKWVSGNPRNLNNHIKIVHSEEDLSVRCDICQQMYPHERALYNHKRLVHTEGKFECEFCGKKFKSKISLKEHRASHTGQPLYSCNVCGMTTNSNANLYTHKKSKHPEEWLEAKKKAIQLAYG
ncbi:transcription factor grauzone-like [Ochlerotatus camptorhynchus]|uniref:transcription factor grauzone-like n=1 Tax=Ochlerotatus camptorhynchus TaxID=644619 RepID=UPI0031DF3692